MRIRALASLLVLTLGAAALLPGCPFFTRRSRAEAGEPGAPRGAPAQAH